MDRTRLSLLCAAIYGIVFTGLVLWFRFELPRFDYWDVVFASTKVVLTDPASIAEYLFSGNESMMATPRLLIYLSNTLGGRHALLLELVAMLLLGLGSHVLLLRILDLPLLPGPAADAGTALRWWLVLALFWWPAVLPTYTNTWFAIQYGLTLFFGLLAIVAYEESRSQEKWLPYSYAAWLIAAITHGTGLVLGPVLALFAAVRDRRFQFSLVLLTGTALVLWVQHQVSRGVAHSVLRVDSPLSVDSIKFLARVVTPAAWEIALFVLLIVPLLSLTAWLYSARFRDYAHKPYSVVVVWGLAVWLSIWFARSGFQDHANPHYLRFFVVLYAAWAMMLLDAAGSGAGLKVISRVGAALFLVVWLKGAETGISQAAEYQAQIRAGAAVLEGESTHEESLCYLYPDAEKFTGLLLPGVVETAGYGYGDLATPRISADPCGFR